MAIITTTATKPTDDSKVGISFWKQHGAIVIKKVSEDSLFASPDLQPGHEIVSVNDHVVKGMEVEAVLALVASTPAGVTITLKTRPPADLTPRASTRIEKQNIGDGGVYIKTNTARKHSIA